MASVSEAAANLQLFLERKEWARNHHPLQYLFWEATLRCNLECRHCGSDCRRDNASASRELPADTVRQQLDVIAAQYDPHGITFAIIGGEPLVRRDIEFVGGHAAKLGFHWGITTNGLLLSEARLNSLKEAGLKTISVSLDGLAVEHEALRQRKGAFARTCAAIARLVAKPFFDEFDVICCVSTLNVNHLKPFTDFLAGLGVPRVRFTPVFSRGRAGANSDLMLNGAQYLQLLEFCAEQRSSRDDIEVTLSEEGYWGPRWECRVRGSMHYCGSGTTIASILHDGAVTGCPSVSRNFIEGSICESNFPNIWENSFERFRQGRRNSAPEACARCPHWLLCEGGGFHLFDPARAGMPTCGLKMINEYWE